MSLIFHDVLQRVDGTSKVDFPHSWVTVLPLLARVYGPLSEESCIPFPVVASLIGVDPWDFEDILVLI